MSNEIEAPPPFIRDFLYVDLGRVRSLLSQLEQGVPEKVEEVNERLSRWNAGAKAFVNVDHSKQDTSRVSETRTLGDLHFSIFEEAAEIAGFLKDITDEARQPLNWTNGTIAKLTEDYKVIRVTCLVRILDAHHFASTIEKIIELGIVPKAQKAAAEGTKKAIRMMYPAGVGILALPAGRQYGDYSFSGTLLERSEYIEQERETLLARHGAKPSEWTVVGLVSRSGRTGANSAPTGLSFGAAPGAGFNRRKLEEMIESVTDYLEGAGLSEAPTSPGIAIVPLAVYRTIEAKV